MTGPSAPSTKSNQPPTRLNPTTAAKMSYEKKGADFGDGPKIHKIRITLTSRKVQSLEKVCGELIERAKTKDLRVKGPVRLPTKHLKVTTRKVCCIASVMLMGGECVKTDREQCELTLCGCRRLVVKVRRRGTPMRCAFTSD